MEQEKRYKVEELSSVCGSHAVYDREDRQLVCICVSESNARYIAALMNADEKIDSISVGG